MPRRRDDGVLDDLFETAALLPWWLGLLSAVACYGVLHHFAVAKVPASATLEGATRALGAEMGRTLASVFQYLLPIPLLLGAAASALGRRKRNGLLRDAAGDASGRILRAMSWRDFESMVGEAFRRRGFSVLETGGGGADGGVDLKLTKDGEVFFVQCKQWRAYKVSVSVVRELLGVMVARGAAGGFVATSGVFTKEAQEFAKGSNVELLDGAALMTMIGEARVAHAGAVPAVQAAAPAQPLAGAPTCPACGRVMEQRTARRGAGAGGAFWGCPAFPRCRGTRPTD